MDDNELRAQIARYPWYHTIDLGNGVSTPGMFDHRGTEDRHLLPADLSGLRCLDVGTMDGFWAFAMERRGAKEVLALDVADPETLDWPASLRPKVVKTLDETKADRFALLRAALGSSVERVPRSVYDLDDDLGRFDVVFCGDLLVHLKDPVTALERIHRVCRGTAVVCNPIRRLSLLDRRPLARFDGIVEFEWWVTNLAGLERMARAAGFSRVERGRPFSLPATGGGPWKGRRGALRCYP
jgi:tRNA (mo5U34)-methyltransferase